MSKVSKILLFTATAGFIALTPMKVDAHEAASSPAAIETAAIPKTWRDLPTGFTNGSEIAYDMRDWDLVLRKSVVFVGHPDRKISRPRQRNAIGSRLNYQNTSVSRLDANRVVLHRYNKRHDVYVRETVERLQQVPSYIPLESLSRDHQLAYWLNLRNVALLAEINKLYPVTNVKKHLQGPKSILNKPVAKVLDIPLSIADIEDYIIATFKDPLVFYGFAYGVVGSPSFRGNAFHGDTVWQALEQNAIEFINSLRGVRDASSSTARVSTFYAQHPELFDVHSADFIHHLRQYSQAHLAGQMEQVTNVTADYNDWHISDLVNGKAVGNIANDFGPSSLPPHALFFIRDVIQKNRRLARRAKAYVTVESLPRRVKPPSRVIIETEEDNDDEIIFVDEDGS